MHANNIVINRQHRHLRDRFWNLFAWVKWVTPVSTYALDWATCFKKKGKERGEERGGQIRIYGSLDLLYSLAD